MASIQVDTIELKELLKKADDTGAIAWRIGAVAERVKETRNYVDMPNKKYKRFEHYTQNELGKEEATIDIYIKIKQSFSFDDIGNILYSHLKQLVRLKDENIRKSALKAFKSLQIQYVIEKDVVEKEKFFTEVSIKNVVDILLKSQEKSETKIASIVQEVLKVKHRIETQKKTDKVGKDLKTNIFKNLEDIIAYEPIDEQGTVGLFCLLLPYIQGIPFVTQLDYKNRKIRFNKIQFIRSRFPDACLTCIEETRKGPVNHLVKIEFEFLSSSYIDHIISREKCHLIVCWENNIDRIKYPIHTFPPIIELKSVLKTGIINVL